MARTKRSTPAAEQAVAAGESKTLAEELENDEALFVSLMAQPAQLTEEQMYSIERSVAAEPGVARRTGLAILGRSMADLAEAVQEKDGAIALARGAVMTDEYAKKLESLTKMMKAATLRVEVALCSREDMQEILRTAKGESTH